MHIVDSEHNRAKIDCSRRLEPAATGGRLDKFGRPESAISKDSNVPPTVTHSQDHDYFTNGWFHQCSSSMKMFEKEVTMLLLVATSLQQKRHLEVRLGKCRRCDGSSDTHGLKLELYRQISYYSNGRCRRQENPCSNGTNTFMLNKNPEEATR